MAERRARVLAVEAGELVLEPESPRCRDCSLGCHGRCNLFSEAVDGRFRLPQPPGLGLVPGDRVSLRLDEARLRWAGYQGYGMALLALLAGAALGYGLAIVIAAAGLNFDPDIPTVMGMAVGLVWAFSRAKRLGLEPEVHLLDPGFD